MLDAVVLDKLTGLYTQLPAPLAARFRTWLRADTHAHAVHGLADFVEALLTRLCDIANTAYHAHVSSGGTPDGRLESELINLPQNLAMGQRAAGLRRFGATLDASDVVSGLLVDLLTKKRRQPAAVARAVSAVKRAIEGRRGYAIPSFKLGAYLRDQLSSGAHTASFHDFIAVVLQVRNALAHKEEAIDPATRKNAWLVHDETFFAALRAYLDPALGAVLTECAPLVELVTRYRRVEVYRSGPAGTVAVKRPDRIGPPLLRDTRLASPAGSAMSGQYLVRVDRDDETSVEPLHRYVVFPQPTRTPDESNRYCAEWLFERLEPYGLLPPADFEDYVEHARGVGWEAPTAEAFLDRITRALEAAADDRPAALVRKADVPVGAPAPLVEASARGLFERRRRYLQDEIFANRFAENAETLARELHLPGDSTATALRRMAAEGLIRALTADGQPDMVVDMEDAHFKRVLFRTDSAEAINAFYRLIGVAAAAGEPLSPLSWTLLELAQRLFTDLGQSIPSGQPPIARALDRLHPLRPSPPETARDTIASGEGLEVVLSDGHRLSSVDWPGMIRVAAEYLESSAQLPGTVLLPNSERAVVASQPRHPDGRAFGMPVRVAQAFVETDYLHAQAHDAARTLLEAGGLTLRNTEFGPVPLIEPYRFDSPMKGDLAIEFETPSGTTQVVLGETVRDLLARVVECLMDAHLVDGIALPLQAGRIRYLLSDCPYHANGRRFLQPARVGGLFIECNSARPLGLAHGRRLLEDAGCTEVETEDRRQRVDLRVNIGGHEVRGASVARFFANAFRHLFASGALSLESLPVSDRSGGQRYVLATEATHGTGRPFSQPRPLDIQGHQLHVEVHHSRARARQIMVTLVERLGLA